MEQLIRFETREPVLVMHREMTPMTLSCDEDQDLVIADGEELRFKRRGWYEVLLTVEWDTASANGHRFSHTAIPDHHPLHSEAIDAGVLNQLSEGRQLLRGNTIFEPDDGAASIRLEVWQSSGAPLTVKHASLDVRELTIEP